MFHHQLSFLDDAKLEDGLYDILTRLPSWRRDKALSFKFDIDRYLCGKSFLMLNDLLTCHYGISINEEFGYGENGKPFLKKHPEIHFNISHCRKGIICAVGDKPLGVDIEEIQFDNDLASEVLDDAELSEVLSSGNPDVRFTEYWTMKESILKLKGTGIADNIKDILTQEHKTRSDFIVAVHSDAGTVTCIVE